MPQKPKPKAAKNRSKKPGKIADLPAKSLRSKDAAAVKGGMTKTELTAVKFDSANLLNQTNLQLGTDSTSLKLAR